MLPWVSMESSWSPCRSFVDSTESSWTPWKPVGECKVLHCGSGYCRPPGVTPQNGFGLVYGFFYEFRKDQCLQISATILCLLIIHQQIIYGMSTSRHTTFP